MSRWKAPKLISVAALLVAATAPISVNVTAHRAHAAPAQPHAAPARPQATGPVNPGFDTGDLTGWTVTEGTAFGPTAVTTTDTYWGGPFHHRGSHHLWGYAAAGDDATGTLRSSSFTAPTRMSFLVGGGWDPERLYVALVRDSDGRALLRQTGPEDEAYVRIVWDTSAWRGQAVHLEVVDRKTGGWGHLNLDDVRTGDAAVRDDNGLTFRTLGQANQPTATRDYAADPLRPQFHYTPYQGWINDPNGVIQWRGRHHLFSQYYPDAPKWGPMHWAHAEGPDAVHWRDLPVALTPPPRATPTDNSGIFSGSAVDDDGTLTVAYTKFTDTGAHPGATPETVAVATSTDGVVFAPGTEVITEAPPGSSAGFRDPKLFRDPVDGRWKMVVGSGDGGRGKVQLYASDDLRTWSYAGVLTEGDGTTGAMWECPDLFELDGKWVLLYSTNEGGRSLQRYAVGTYDGARFSAERHGVLDGGGDVYAAQSYRDDAGRRVMTAWMSDWNAKEPTRVGGWAGAQSLHRELFLTADGRLGQRPLAAADSLADGRTIRVTDRTVDGSWRLGRGDTARIRAVLDLGGTTADTVTLRLKASAAEATVLRYEKSTGTLTLDTSAAGYGTRATYTTHVEPRADATLALDIFVDRSSVEVFTGDGAALTARVYPRYRESDAVEFTATGGHLRLKSASLTPLGSAVLPD
ncbi:glycoside hydrolase family 32 protein [Streptomyces sp. ISL-36]|uniref:glycoside hydrolase family 32 protein n=1 Tax=Streptomyces sp. ISL-36 TaxID=2819182 RepID=UPI001BE51AF7|nr:GH32 C-terminal domain-containing protein [Streptomyces sp. ISL-36]MBT2444267.1 glycoside hydrolase family 32 protein [Streptomyces sp. ISL-36]